MSSRKIFHAKSLVFDEKNYYIKEDNNVDEPYISVENKFRGKIKIQNIVRSKLTPTGKKNNNNN